MRSRPKEFALLAGVLLLIASSLPMQVMVSYGFGPAEISQILGGLAPLNWVVMVAAIIHAFFVYQASSASFVTGPLFVALVGWNNWVVASIGINASSSVALLATLGAMVAHIPLARGNARRVLLNPKLRWWRTAPRRRIRVPANLRPVLGGEIRTRTFDISVGGAFLTLEDAVILAESQQARNRPLRGLKVGTRCSVRLSLDQLNVVQCGAEVVRHAEPIGEHPGGVAVRFVCLDDFQRKALAQFVASRSIDNAHALQV